jgi:hypothetical protein
LNQSNLIGFQINITPSIKLPVSNITPSDIVDNPSKIYYTERNNISTSYNPSSFGIKELNKNSLLVTYKDSSTIHLLSIDGSFGDKFTSSNLKYSLGLNLLKNFIPSVSFNYHYLQIQGFNSYSTLSVDMNGVLKLSEFLNFGFSLTNILNSKFEEYNSITKQSAIFGLEYKFEDDFIFHLGSEIRIESNAGLIIGFVKKFKNLGNIGISYNTNPQMLEFNTIFNISSDVGIIYRLNYHNYLGSTHHFGLGYQFD